MKKLIVGFLSVMLAITVAAEDKDVSKTVDSDSNATVAVSGTIYDSETGELLVGVEVSIDDLDTKTYTDLDGKFSFENIRPGEYKLVSDYISYEKATQVVNLNTKATELKITMETSK
jgi:uncharacterized surface anchored protein